MRESRSGTILRAVFALGVVAVAAAYVAAAARQQWDFETYYFAGTAFRAGLNPYSLRALTSVAHRAVELPFLYPPVTLALFVPLSLLPISVAGGVWLGFKVLLIAYLIGLWRRVLLRGLDLSLVVAVTLLGFEMSALWDVRTGNVALVEAALLWAALSAYARDRVGLATYRIALGSVFKLLPAMLLGLIVLARRRARTRVMLIAGGLLFLVAAVSLPPGLSAVWRWALTHAPPDARVMGGINPSALGLADWLFTTAGVSAGSVPALAVAAYLAWACLVLLLSAWALRRASAAGSLEQIALVTLLWLILSPRLMVYSMTMGIAPALYVIETRIPSRAGRWGAASLLMVQGVIRLLPGQPPAMLGAASFLLLVATWALLVIRPPREPLPAVAVPHSPAPAPG